MAMRTAPREQDECQCRGKENFRQAGVAATLCQHSSPDELERANRDIVEMMGKLDKDVSLEEMMSRPFVEAMEYYVQHLSGKRYAEVRNTPAELILQAAFMRHYDLTVQALSVSKLQEIARLR